MRLVYMDEAGLSNPRHEPWLTVAGVIIDADSKLIAVERHLQAIVKRYIPQEHGGGFVFHATEIFNGRKGTGLFGRDNPDWTLAKRLEIAAAIAAIPNKFDLPLAITGLERANYPSTTEIPASMSKAEITVAQHVTAFMGCATLIECWMRQKAPNEICMLVVENNEQAKSAIRDLQSQLRDPGVTAVLTEETRPFYPLRKIKEEPFFQDKRPGSALQLADFFAYLGKKMFMEDSRYDPLVQMILGKMILLKGGPDGMSAKIRPALLKTQWHRRSR